MRAVLRPVSVDDPRPTLTSPSVATRAATAHASELLTALVVGAEKIDQMRNALIEDFVAVISGPHLPCDDQGLPNGYAVAERMHTRGYGLGITSVRALFHMIESLSYSRRVETIAWSQRRAFGDPSAPGDSAKPVAREGDVIEWYEPGGREVSGKVAAVNRAQRTLTVHPQTDMDRFITATPQAAKVIVEESVYANTTQGKYAFETFAGMSDILPEPELLPIPAPVIDTTKIAPFTPPQGPSVA